MHTNQPTRRWIWKGNIFLSSPLKKPPKKTLSSLPKWNACAFINPQVAPLIQILINSKCSGLCSDIKTQKTTCHHLGPFVDIFNEFYTTFCVLCSTFACIWPMYPLKTLIWAPTSVMEKLKIKKKTWGDGFELSWQRWITEVWPLDFGNKKPVSLIF